MELRLKGKAALYGHEEQLLAVVKTYQKRERHILKGLAIICNLTEGIAM
ncbi:MAG: hypothetical protein JRH08_11490 [Deltaproteobacteria bacterium]|nr:hypothetical protein [Deltaproteobacteria bacterium]MBW1931265.1 hypothetical protein [Deltaproteobacteria bacterium]MBW2026399.1 hypothetical protein [Deltaproteobacteria bacterium]MBW2126294.1 hypothetical protein [Deltaproteobacteria bacterium]